MTLVVHTSLRAVRPVEDGPDGLIAALTDVIGPSGTLVMPTMTGSRRLEPFDPAQTPTRNMGIVAETFWRQPDVMRSDHPTSSFAARGPLAADITAPQPLMPVHGSDSPVGRVHAADGWILLLGAGHDANTTIHLAEHIAGVLYREHKWTTMLIDGRPQRVEFEAPDHCCRNFELVGGWLDERGLQRHGTVGQAAARVVRSEDVIDVTVPVLQKDPLRFLCRPDAGCDDCDLARRSVAQPTMRGNKPAGG
ncbi:MAG: AAC(3) family N-acetyltransferase [Chloroflexota bacterium]|nr:AAC(3) family N-acetyltransferase [Chloroflexota bacterium]